jgi:signal transduction histidine kinase
VIDRLGLRILVVAAVLDVILGGLIRVWGVGGHALAPEAVLSILSAAAALCVVGLSIDRRPTVAWLATITGLSIATIDLASLARSERPSATAEAWMWWSVAITLSCAFATGAAVIFASRPGLRLTTWAPAVGVILIVGIVFAGAWSIAIPGEWRVAGGSVSLGNLAVVTRLFLVGTLGHIALGVVAGARPAGVRARMFLAETRPRPKSARDRLALAPIALVALGREMSPWRDRIVRAERSGRARITSELHAAVIPGLRRALREAERTPSDSTLVTALRDVLQQTEDIVTAETLLHLADGGLVPSLEALAERIEDRSEVRVMLEVPDGDPGSGGRPPIRVTEAAVRIATLALDNVTRHAPAANVNVRVVESRDRLSISIADDGPGLPDRGTRMVRGGRGLLDMATEAASVGAFVIVDTGAGGRGTNVEFQWPASSRAPDRLRVLPQ